MLLQRLLERGAASGSAGPSMYKEAPVRYEVQLDRNGNLLGLVTLSGGDGKRDRGKPMLVPARQRSGTAPKPILLADTPEYALGIGRPDKAAAYHAAFTELVRACAAATGEQDVAAVLRFLERAPAERGPLPSELEPGAVTFSIEGRYPIDLPAVRAFWAAYADRSQGADADAGSQCVVCRQRKPVVDRYPLKIQGVRGAQGSGAALVTANANAFESYGLTASYIAPTCSTCAETVCQTLNQLLADPGSRLYLGPLTYIYWTREPTTFQWGTLLERPDTAQVEALLLAARTGRHGALSLDSNAFYCLGLAGNSGRIAVRDWIDITVPEAQANLGRYFALQRIVDRDGELGRYVGAWALARATVRTGARDAEPAPGVAQALLHVALRGGPMPDMLLAQVVRRLHAEQGVSHERAALVKMVLLSGLDDGWEDTLVDLEESNRDPAYLCGRLLAVLDSIQRAALGQRNATIVDRFFGAASTAPVSVFGRLVRGAQPHLAKMRRDKPAAYAALESRLQEIMEGIDTFPRTLTLRQQGLFALGYYHQKAADARAARERSAARRADEAAAVGLAENDVDAAEA